MIKRTKKPVSVAMKFANMRQVALTGKQLDFMNQWVPEQKVKINDVKGNNSRSIPESVPRPAIREEAPPAEAWGIGRSLPPSDRQ